MGCSGPLIGVRAAIPIIIIGLKLSTVTVSGGGGQTGTLGEPLLFKLLSWLALGSLTPEQNVVLHPVAFAGWLGLLVTALNLLPVGQLDGGHVAYALFPEYHRYISLGVIGLLVVCGVLFWSGWLLWAVLLVFLGRATRRRISSGCPWTGAAGCWGSSPSWCSGSLFRRRPLSWVSNHHP